jgi:hypothetical protein
MIATPAPGYAFLWWEGDVPEGSNRAANPLAIVVDSTVDLRALFATNDANCRTWTGDGVTTMASNPTNWHPAANPVSGNHIIFDATSTKQCTWDLNIEPASWRQDAGYSDFYSGLEGFKGWIWFKTKFPGQESFTNLAISGDVMLADGAWSHPDNTGLNVEVERLSVSAGGQFTLGTGAVINVTGRGFAAVRGPGAGNNLQRSWSLGYGASHGGRGANSVSNPPAPCYGSFSSPTNLGSGAIQAGGGAIRLAIQGNAILDGTISALGAEGDTQRPGAAGGSIWITASALSGSGLLDASGSACYNAGGGGRVAVWLSSGTSFDGVRLRATGGVGPYMGAAGTLYRQTPSEKTLTIDNNNQTISFSNFAELEPLATHPPENWAQTALIVTNRGAAGLTTNLTMNDLFVLTNSTLYLGGHTLTLKSPYHADWGTPSRVVYAEGQIIWPATGTLIMIR